MIASSYAISSSIPCISSIPSVTPNALPFTLSIIYSTTLYSSITCIASYIIYCIYPGAKAYGGDCGIARPLTMTQLELSLAELNHDGERGRNAIMQKQSFDSLIRCIDSADAVIVH